MIKKISRGFLLCVAFCVFNTAWADENGSCTHSPQTLTLAPGQSAQVTYNCSNLQGLPNANFMPTFNPNDTSTLPYTYSNGITVSAVSSGVFANPYTVQVSVSSSGVAGTYSAPITAISVGGSFNIFTDSNALQVTVASATAPSVSASTALSCATPINAGTTSACSVTYTNNGTADATGVTVSPSVTSGPGSISGTQGCQSATLKAGGGSCQQTFTYNAPATVSSATQVGLQTTYVDAQTDSVAPSTTNVLVNLAPTANISVTALSCATPINAGTTSACSVTYTNNGTADATGVTVSPSVTSGPGSISGTRGCQSATLKAGGGSCQQTFTYNAPATVSSATQVGLETTYSDTQNDTVSPSTTNVLVNPVAPPSVPNVSVTSTLSCATPINAGTTSACSVTYTNNGTADTGTVTVSPSITSGPGSISGTQGCQSMTLKAGGGFCQQTFVYNAPPTVSAATQVSLQTAYVDATNPSDTVAPSTTVVTVNPITPPPPSADVTVSGSCGILAGASSADCKVSYTNTTSNTLTIDGFSATNPTGASIVAPTPQPPEGGCTPTGPCGCPQMSASGQAGDTCHAFYTFTPTYSSGSVPPTEFQTQMTYGTSNTPINYTVPVTFNSVVTFDSFTCNASHVTAGTSTQCTLTLNSTVPQSSSIPNFTLTPTVSPANAGTLTAASGNPTSIVTGTNTFYFTYTAPVSTTATTVSLSVAYSDYYGDGTISPTAPVVISLSSAMTTSGIRCYPDPAQSKGSLNCNMYLTNISSSAISNVVLPTVTIAGKPVTPTSTCLPAALASNQPCEIFFGVKNVGKANSVVISVTPASSNANLFGTVTRTVAVYGNASIQSNPITCDATQLAPGGTTHCFALFRNMGSTQVTGLSVTPAASDGTQINDSGMTCSSQTTGTMNSGDTCVDNFSYTAPSPLSANFVELTDYSTNKIYPAFQKPYSLLLQNTANTQLTSSIVPPLPANNVEYNGSLPVTFGFANNSTSTVNITGYKIFAISGDQIQQLLDIDGTVGSNSCTGQMNAYNNGIAPACNLVVNFMPYVVNGFKAGDSVQLVAWLDTSAGPTQTATWTTTVGDPAGFSDVYGNQIFVQNSGGQNTYVGAFVFGNNSSSAFSNLRSARLFLPAGFTISDNSCPSGLTTKYLNATPCAGMNSLAAQANCYACFSVQSSATLTLNSNVLLAAELPYSGSATHVKTQLPVTPAYRQITLTNNCAGPVWPAFVGGAAYYYCNQATDCPTGNMVCNSANQCVGPSSSPDNTNSGCAANSAACPNQSTCNPAAGKGDGVCFWNLPNGVSTLPASGLAANNGTATVQIPNVPLTAAGMWSPVWGGGVVARTGCDVTGTCQTGNCTVSHPTQNFNCDTDSAPLPPASQAEFTFLFQNQDYYDITLINGATVPMSMAPTNPPGTFTNPYICSNAGAAGGGICSWTFKMQSYDIMNSTKAIAYGPSFAALHTLVSSGGVSCVNTTTNGADPSMCQSPQVCGLSMANKSITATPVFTCGQVLGFWTADQICGNNKTLNYTSPDGATLNCGTTYGVATLTQWLGCAGSANNSCYGTSPGTDCCGCPYWAAGKNNPKGANPPSTYFQQLFPSGFVLFPNSQNDYCKNYSSTWIGQVMNPYLIWMKQGCASAYTFPYDDATSIFMCSTATPGTMNQQNYTITFCPGSHQGSVNSNPIVVPGQNQQTLLKQKLYRVLSWL